MVIKNKNGEFSLTAPQFNYLTNTFIFNEINKELVTKTNFIVSTYEYEKADELLLNNPNYKHLLKY